MELVCVTRFYWLFLCTMSFFSSWKDENTTINKNPITDIQSLLQWKQDLRKLWKRGSLSKKIAAKSYFDWKQVFFPDVEERTPLFLKPMFAKCRVKAWRWFCYYCASQIGLLEYLSLTSLLTDPLSIGPRVSLQKNPGILLLFNFTFKAFKCFGMVTIFEKLI